MKRAEIVGVMGPLRGWGRVGPGTDVILSRSVIQISWPRVVCSFVDKTWSGWGSLRTDIQGVKRWWMS